ncbi:hypothetical protein [Paucibacter sp. B51]|uniref:hypothetical protein n=1 Tax=Paucibacter sp. B51 TaxID=2993315 RepID=UPI0022EBF2D4|nr:hypothetical protein [Paucibacter sp. B51]
MSHLEALSAPLGQLMDRLMQGLRGTRPQQGQQAIEGLEVTESTWQDWLDTCQRSPDQAAQPH